MTEKTRKLSIKESLDYVREKFLKLMGDGCGINKNARPEQIEYINNWLIDNETVLNLLEAIQLERVLHELTHAKECEITELDERIFGILRALVMDYIRFLVLEAYNLGVEDTKATVN